MAEPRKTRKRKRAKRTWGKPPVPPPSLVVEEVRGELRVIKPDTGKRDRGGHRLALVEDVVTGERREVRAANVVSGNTKSAGRIKKERYKERKAKSEAARFMDLGDIDPELLDAARRLGGSDVDASSGECVSAVKQQSVSAQAAPEAAKAPGPKLEDKLRALIPYLDVKYGTVTFSRVPQHLRNIDGNNCRELLQSASIIDAKLFLTEKGKTWLAQS